ncbi:hypothetical protein K493DRAFT_316823 [Basidiobolus meristosporus CBS 931.73]|uniref:Phosphotransferase n=1 Tax=Basidiobolus meristosporus CBS 931.73 TaxID=1314790 RepID=A0A1Y1Y384_9FUNG|nr:hypothetical protein K493DRAFT_316823 [Basidiobolus meristosporus CBS 931.73]|eukprot:ORX92054.1 hypothetical protein K493DRAFT_316823 [Basidiobolus meristosporus CBS 931.73]
MNPEQIQAMNALEEQFSAPAEQLQKIKEHFLEQIKVRRSDPKFNGNMIPSFITDRATGDEVGQFLALDLGGTNLRVCLVTLKGQGQIALKQHKFNIPNSLKTGDHKELFQTMAQNVELFLGQISNQIDVDGKPLPLGFTFSYPIDQTAIDSGKLVRWNKGFDIPGAVGRDVVQLLQYALDNLGLNVKVVAILNDTVGTLLASSYQDRNSVMGVILGTGSNTAFIEKTRNITKMDLSHIKSDDMIVNIEWGAFDNERVSLPCTMFDNHLDRESISPGSQIFEKMISGEYLGTLVQLVLFNLIDRRLIFDGRSSKMLNTPFSFETSYMSTIESDTTENLTDTKSVLENSLDINDSTLTDRQMLKRICHMIGRRAARLAGAGLAAVVSARQDLLEQSVTIGIDGSLFEFYPGFEGNLTEAMRELLGSDIVENHIKLTMAKDGSGVGAALAAMVALKIKNQL